MSHLIWIALGGSLGAISRYLNSSIIKYLVPNLPLGTLFVNILGSFFIGVLMDYLENKNVSENFIKFFLIIGFLGSYTTFSSFSYEAIDLFNNKKFLISLIFIFLSITGCLFFTFLGYNINKI